jgi:hypothetical protein
VAEVSGPAEAELQDQRVLLGVGQHQDLGLGIVRLEEDPHPSGEAHPLDQRAAVGSHQHQERAAGARVLELDVDLAGGMVEPELEPDGRGRLEHEVAR